MDATLLELLRCPICRSRLVASGDERLDCPGCGRTYAVRDGIPLLLHLDLPGAREKLGEVEGWVAKAKAEGWYEPDDEIDSHLPFLNRDLGWEDGTWGANEHSFQMLLDRYVSGKGRLRVLEVGAAKAWAAPYWRALGCEYVATDILTDTNIGLGRGAFYGDFGRVQADGEHLPFADETFDVTYCCATLHHALDLPRDGRRDGPRHQARRHGRRAQRGHEGRRPQLRQPRPGRREGARDQRARAHRLGLRQAFTRAGLVLRRVERSDGYPPGRVGSQIARVPKVGQTLGTLVHLTAGEYSGVTIYARRR